MEAAAWAWRGWLTWRAAAALLMAWVVLHVAARVAEPVPGRSHADNLVDMSYEPDVELLVIGVRRRSPVGKLLLGSLSQRVLLDAHCPVVAVKPPVEVAH
mgnify:CR=1 FL=1